MVCKTFILVCLLISVINCTDQPTRCKSSCKCNSGECCLTRTSPAALLTGVTGYGYCQTNTFPGRCDPNCEQCRCRPGYYCNQQGYCRPLECTSSCQCNPGECCLKSGILLTGAGYGSCQANPGRCDPKCPECRCRQGYRCDADGYCRPCRQGASCPEP